MNKRKKSIISISAGMAALLAFSIVFNVLSLNKFDNIFEKFFGATEPTLRGETLGADVDYVKSDFSGPADLYAYEEKKVAQIAEEGITLLDAYLRYRWQEEKKVAASLQARQQAAERSAGSLSRSAADTPPEQDAFLRAFRSAL